MRFKHWDVVRDSIRSAMLAAILTAGLSMLPGCVAESASLPPESGQGQAETDMDIGGASVVYLYLDQDGMRRDGVVTVRNEGDAGVSDLRIRFGVTEKWQTESGLSDKAHYIQDAGAVEYELGDLPAGETVEADISGLLHQRWDSSSGVSLVYSEGSQDCVFEIGVIG